MNILTLLVTVVLLLVFYNIYNRLHNNSTQQQQFVIVGSKKCGYTLQLLEHLRKIGKIKQFIYKDIKHESNKKLLELLKAEGVPCIVNEENGKHLVGFHEYDEIVKDLS